VEFTGVFAFFEGSPHGGAVFSGVMRFFEPSFSRPSFGFVKLMIHFVLISVPAFAR
jgi:hypothetical protein